MRIIQSLVSVITTVALVVTFVAVGFVVCLLPPTTHQLSNIFASEDVSPFNRAQLAQVADATRDYAFGSHNKLALYQTIYEVDEEYLRSVEAAGGEAPAEYPHLDAVANFDSVDQLEKAFAGASEVYCFSKESVSHLDDCYAICFRAVPVLIAVAVLAVIGLVIMGVVWQMRQIFMVLTVSGAVVILAFVLLGLWAALDFTGLFTMFHQVFFSQGNWQFPYNSLLICSLPTEFWMGMGGLWLLTSFVASLASILIGCALRHSKMS